MCNDLHACVPLLVQWTAVHLGESHEITQSQVFAKLLYSCNIENTFVKMLLYIIINIIHVNRCIISSLTAFELHLWYLLTTLKYFMKMKQLK